MNERERAKSGRQSVEASQTVSAGNGGWVCMTEVEESGVIRANYVRFALIGDRLIPQELYMPRCVSVTELRRFPFADVEAMVNDPDFREHVIYRLDIPGPLLGVAASHFAHSYSGPSPRRLAQYAKAGRKPPGPGDNWVVDMLGSQLEKSGIPPVGIHRPARVTFQPPQPIDARLKKPDKAPYGDDFYRSVAQIYSQLAASASNPGGLLADANGVNVTAAHRWIRVARERGFLPPGHKGKRG